MSPEECVTHLGESKDVLVARYKRNIEVALMRADFLNSLEIITLQAFTIYIVSKPQTPATVDLIINLCWWCFHTPCLLEVPG
jgi:hypothetical protein